MGSQGAQTLQSGVMRGCSSEESLQGGSFQDLGWMVGQVWEEGGASGRRRQEIQQKVHGNDPSLRILSYHGCEIPVSLLQGKVSFDSMLSLFLLL